MATGAAEDAVPGTGGAALGATGAEFAIGAGLTPWPFSSQEPTAKTTTGDTSAIRASKRRPTIAPQRSRIEEAH